jgi:hypothetical protein
MGGEFSMHDRRRWMHANLWSRNAVKMLVEGKLYCVSGFCISRVGGSFRCDLRKWRRDACDVLLGDFNKNYHHHHHCRRRHHELLKFRSITACFSCCFSIFVLVSPDHDVHSDDNDKSVVTDNPLTLLPYVFCISVGTERCLQLCGVLPIIRDAFISLFMKSD